MVRRLRFCAPNTRGLGLIPSPETRSHIPPLRVHVLSGCSSAPLCDPVDRSPPGFSVHGILQARILEWGAVPPPGDLRNPGIERNSMSPALAVLGLFSRVQLSATPWTVAPQPPLSMGFSRQEYWRGLPFPSPGDLPDPGIEPRCPAWAGGFFTSESQEFTCCN